MTKEFHGIESFRSSEAKSVIVDNRCPYVPYAKEHYDKAVKCLVSNANTRDVFGKPAVRIAENVGKIEAQIKVLEQAKTITR